MLDDFQLLRRAADGDLLSPETEGLIGEMRDKYDVQEGEQAAPHKYDYEFDVSEDRPVPFDEERNLDDQALSTGSETVMKWRKWYRESAERGEFDAYPNPELDPELFQGTFFDGPRRISAIRTSSPQGPLDIVPPPPRHWGYTGGIDRAKRALGGLPLVHATPDTSYTATPNGRGTIITPQVKYDLSFGKPPVVGKVQKPGG